MAEEQATAARLTDEQVAAITEWAHVHGKARARAQGPDRFNSADYLAGVMTAFFACASQDMIPARWVFGVMAGGDPLDPMGDRERVLLETAKTLLNEKANDHGTVPNQFTALRIAVQRLMPGWTPGGV